MYNYLKKNKKRGFSMIEYLKIKQKNDFVRVRLRKKKFSRITKKRNKPSVLSLQDKLTKLHISTTRGLKIQKKSKFMKKLLLKRSFLKKRKSNVASLTFLKNNGASRSFFDAKRITRKFAFKLYNYKFKFRQKMNFYNATLYKTS